MKNYIPSIHDTDCFQAYEEIKKAVSRARVHETYLTNEQIAMAVFSGLAEFNGEDDAVQIGSELMELAKEVFEEPKHEQLPF